MIAPKKYTEKALQLRKFTHNSLSLITNHIESFQMNVAVAKIYEIINELNKFKASENSEKFAQKELIMILIRISEPMMPHITQEAWSILNNQTLLALEPWPKIEKKLLIDTSTTVVIQINGRKKGEINITIDADEKDVFTQAMKIENISSSINQDNIKKKIYIKNKILNIVI